MSAKAGLFFFLICLTSQGSGRPPDLWHLRQSAERIQMIRKEKPSTAGPHGTAHSYSWSSHFMNSRCSPELTVPTTSPSMLLGFITDKSLSFIHTAYNVTEAHNLDYCRGSSAFNLYPEIELSFFPSDCLQFASGSTTQKQYNYLKQGTTSQPLLNYSDLYTYQKKLLNRQLKLCYIHCLKLCE